LLHVNAEHCTGCGACLDVCPSEAIKLIGGIANIRMDFCQECQACVYACLQGAIEPVGELAPVVEGEVVTPRREIVVQPPAGVPTRSTPRLWLLSLSAALSYVGREILPTVVTSLLEAWKRSQASTASGVQPAEDAALSNAVRGGGNRRRWRWGRRR
jgi:NAD-dependent dihydropyrimidine dehydrogenase PreA subunit